MEALTIKNTDIKLSSHSTSKKLGTSSGKIVFSSEKILEYFSEIAGKLALKAISKAEKEGEKIAVKFSAPSEKALRLAIRKAKGKEEISIFNGKLAKSFSFGLSPEEIKKEEEKAFSTKAEKEEKEKVKEKEEKKKEEKKEAPKNEAKKTTKKAAKK